MTSLSTSRVAGVTGDANLPGPLQRLQRPRGRVERATDRLVHLAAFAAAMLVLATVVLMLADTTQTARPVLAHVGSLLGSQDWQPSAGHFGALAFVWGTVVSSIVALVLAVPVSIGVALFLVELSPRRLRGVLVAVVDLLAAIPSVVYGLWGVLVLVPWLATHAWGPTSSALGGAVPLFAGPATGRSMATAGVLLAVMAVPVITAIAREVLSTAPREQREAALALGATRWEVVRLVVLPHARAGIVGAVMLGFGRAVGETIAVALVIGSAAVVDTSLFHPGYTMASVIANEFPESTGDHVAALVAVGVVLFAMTLLVNVVARALVWRSNRSGGTR